MIDLKNPKWEDFHIIDANQRELRPGEKVRCGLYRAKPGCQPNDIKRDGISTMRKMEVITMFNANCWEIPNNPSTHSLFKIIKRQ